MIKNYLVLFSIVLLSACSNQDTTHIMRDFLGYIPPPAETSIDDELKLEFKRCEKINADRNCAQLAYDIVRKVKGLEPRKVPKGIVIILEGDIDLEN